MLVMKKDKGQKSKDSGLVEKKGREHSDRKNNFEPRAREEKKRRCECRLSAVSVWRMLHSVVLVIVRIENVNLNKFCLSNGSPLSK